MPTPSEFIEFQASSREGLRDNAALSRSALAVAMHPCIAPAVPVAPPQVLNAPRDNRHVTHPRTRTTLTWNLNMLERWQVPSHHACHAKMSQSRCYRSLEQVTAWLRHDDRSRISTSTCCRVRGTFGHPCAWSAPTLRAESEKCGKSSRRPKWSTGTWERRWCHSSGAHRSGAHRAVRWGDMKHPELRHR